MSGLGCGGQCGEDVACRECAEPAYCLNDPPAWHPCPHDEHLCHRTDCLATCTHCRTEMEAEMFRTGVYSEAADPLVDHTALAHEATYEARTAMPGFDPATNSYRRPK